MFDPQWNRLPRKIKKRYPELFRYLLEEKRSNELQNLGYEYIMIRDFFKEYKGQMNFNSVSKAYEKMISTTLQNRDKVLNLKISCSTSKKPM